MRLIVNTCNDKARPKKWAEDIITAHKAATFKPEVDEIKLEPRQLDAQLMWIDYACTRANNPTAGFVWNQIDYKGKGWVLLRKDGNCWLANHANAIALSEQADESIMETLQNQQSPTAEWEHHMSSAEVAASLLLLTKTGVHVDGFDKSELFVQTIVPGLPAKGNMAQMLEAVYDLAGSVVGNRMRHVANSTTTYILEHGVFPDAMQNYFKTMDGLQIVAFARCNCVIASLGLKNLLPKEMLALLSVDELGPIDATIQDKSLWVQVWRWLLSADNSGNACSPEEFAGRIDQVNVMLNPMFAAEDSQASDGPNDKENKATKSGKGTQTKDTQITEMKPWQFLRADEHRPSPQGWHS